MKLLTFKLGKCLRLGFRPFSNAYPFVYMTPLFWIAFFALFLALLITDSAWAQKKRGRGRKGKNGADQCHQKEVVKCFDKLTALGKEDEPTSIIATSSGLNRICKWVIEKTVLYFTKNISLDLIAIVFHLQNYQRWHYEVHKGLFQTLWHSIASRDQWSRHGHDRSSSYAFLR